MRDELPVWSVEELVTRYSLEPTLRDCFVEGPFDKALLSSAADALQLREITFYEIDVVDIPAALRNSNGLTYGKKQNVLTLALALRDTGGTRYRLIVDSDLDHWFPPRLEAPGLVWTEHCSLECYFLNQRNVEDVVVRAGAAEIADFGAFYGSLIETLRSLFAMRLADRALDLGIKWIDKRKLVEIDDKGVRLDEEEYANRTLNASGAMEHAEAFLDEFKRRKEECVGDPRDYVRGHDFIELMGLAISRLKGNRAVADLSVIASFLIVIAGKEPAKFSALLES